MVRLLHPKRRCDMEPEKHSITPQRVIEILKKNNIIVTVEQAEKMIEFMEKLAKIAIEVYVK
jgi:superfamily II helicase